MGKSRVEPANLSEKQMLDIKTAILNEFPSLVFLQDELTYAIGEYSKDKNFIKNLMKNKTPIDAFMKEAPETKANIETIKQGTPEYEAVIKKMGENAKKAVHELPQLPPIYDIESCTEEKI